MTILQLDTKAILSQTVLAAHLLWPSLSQALVEVYERKVLVGLALLVIWVGSLQIMLDKGQELDWFHSGEYCWLPTQASSYSQAQHLHV